MFFGCPGRDDPNAFAALGECHVENCAVADAKQTETLFTIVLTAIDPFDSECVTESLDRFQKCDAVLVDVGRRLLSVPFESLVYL
jgi:hypothetical protein